MSKDARLSIRITAELDEWLGEEADMRGLDKASFARMALFERMNGLAKPAFIPPLTVTPAPPIQAESEIETEYSPPSFINMFGAANHVSRPKPELEYPFDAPDEAIDIDAIVAQRVAEELARRPAAPEPYNEGSLGMTAHRRAQAPIYSSLGSSPRIQRQSVWTTTA